MCKQNTQTMRKQSPSISQMAKPNRNSMISLVYVLYFALVLYSLAPNSVQSIISSSTDLSSSSNATRSTGDFTSLINDEEKTANKQTTSSSRGGRMLNLDKLSGDLTPKTTDETGNRQSRMLASDINTATSTIEGRSKKSGGKKMSIKGFIPIVSLEDGKSGKHFGMDSLGGGDSNDEDESDSSDQQPYASSSGKSNQIATNFGQTNIGHASFAPQQQSGEPYEQDARQDGRAQRLINSGGLLGGLMNGGSHPTPKRFISSLVAPNNHNYNNGYGSQTLGAPMNLPLGSPSGQGHTLVEPQGECICVPFFQCKNGYLSGSQLSRAQAHQIAHLSAPTAHQVQVPRSLQINHHQQTPQTQYDLFGDPQQAQSQQQQQQQQQHQQQQQYDAAMQLAKQANPLSQPADPQVINDIYEQLRKNIENGNLDQQLQYAQQNGQLLDERSKDGSNKSHDNSTVLPASDVEERSLLGPSATWLASRRQGSTQKCGIMRTCCRVPPTLTQASNRYPIAQRPPQAGRLVSSDIGHSSLTRPHPMVQPLRAQYQTLHPALATAHQHQQQPGQGLLEAIQQSAPGAMMAMHQQAGGDHYQSAPSALVHSSNTAALLDLPSVSRPPYSPGSPASGSFMSGRCGVRQALGISGRVQNTQPALGTEVTADFGEFPAHAAILKRISPGDSLFVCSAVLVSSQWLATAAHCVRRSRPDELKVRLGEWDVNRDDEFYPFVESNVREIVIHPEFQATSLHNDIALLRIETTLDQQQMPHIAPACLATPVDQQMQQQVRQQQQQQTPSTDNHQQQRCWVAGWGKDAFGQSGAFQSVLKKVDLPLVSRQDCEMALRFHTKLGRYFRLHGGNICAGGERGKDACEGDGGAGLYCLDPETGLSKAVGLVSWGVGCGQVGVPGVYTSIGSYSQWIESVVAASGEEGIYADRSSASNGISENSFKSLISERTIGSVPGGANSTELSGGGGGGDSINAQQQSQFRSMPSADEQNKAPTGTNATDEVKDTK